MTAVCPKTHYDVLKSRMPGIIGMIERRFYGNPDIDRDIEFGDRHIDMLSEIARRQGIRGNLRKRFSEFMVTPQDIFPDKKKLDVLWEVTTEIDVVKSFNQHQRKVFYFSDNLTDKLLDTHVNLTAEFLTLPFPAVMFVYNSQSVRDLLPDGADRKDGCVSVYLRPDALGETGVPTILATVGYFREHRNLGSAERVIPLNPGSSVEDAIRASEVVNNANIGDEISRLVANSILYLASSNPDITAGIRDASRIQGDFTKRQIREMVENATHLSFTYVGGASNSYRRNEEEPLKGIGRPLTTKVKVIGHWKVQAHGPNWSQRRTIHIEPYWKGKDLAAALDRPYRVT